MFYGAHNLHVSLCVSWAVPVFQSIYKYMIRALRYLTIFTKYKYLQSKENDFSWTSWPLKMGPIVCSETSVTNYHSTLRRIPEERRSQIKIGETHAKVQEWLPQRTRKESNVYWTVHHCNSWRMKDQLDVTCYFISLIMCSTCFGH